MAGFAGRQTPARIPRYGPRLHRFTQNLELRLKDVAKIPQGEHEYQEGGLVIWQGSGSLTIDWRKGNYHELVLLADTTLDFIDPKGPSTFWLLVTNNGGNNLTFPMAKTKGGTAEPNWIGMGPSEQVVLRAWHPGRNSTYLFTDESGIQTGL